MRLMLLVPAVAALWGAATVAAQEQELTIVTFPKPPSPDECVVAPVSEEDLRPPPASLTTVGATPVDDPFAGTRPADRRLFSEIAGLEQVVAACLNLNDWRLVAALWTDDFRARAVAALGDRVDEFFPAETEPLEPIDWYPVVVTDLRQRDDGRLVAKVNFCDFQEIHTYEREDGDWRIDDIVRIEETTGCYLPDPPP